MRKIIVLLITVFTFGNTNAQVKNVLFLGNSYTGVNNLPLLVKDVALSFGDTLNTSQNTPGGYTYNLHTSNSTTLSLIQSQPWDFVILQEQSQIPSLPQSITLGDYSVPHSVTLNNLIKNNYSCTETVFYMTWGRKNGDASYCASHPPVCTYDGMQQELRNTYMFMADTNKATVSPVGVAWKNVRDSFPLIELYAADGSHPSIHGSYLTACVFYATIYQKSPIGSSYIPAGINATDALNLQAVASSTVLDSLSLWRIGANLPIANFNYSGGGTINFTNTSTNGAFYYWDFGDGNTSTLQNPNNTYSFSNTYTVQLITFSTDSCFSDTITQNVSVIIAGMDGLISEKEFKIYPNPTADIIKISTTLNYTSVFIIDVTGKQLFYSDKLEKIDLSYINRGIYFVHIYDGNKLLAIRKVIRN